MDVCGGGLFGQHWPDEDGAQTRATATGRSESAPFNRLKLIGTREGASASPRSSSRLVGWPLTCPPPHTHTYNLELSVLLAITLGGPFLHIHTGTKVSNLLNLAQTDEFIVLLARSLARSGHVSPAVLQPVRCRLRRPSACHPAKPRRRYLILELTAGRAAAPEPFCPHS